MTYQLTTAGQTLTETLRQGNAELSTVIATVHPYAFQTLAMLYHGQTTDLPQEAIEALIERGFVQEVEVEETTEAVETVEEALKSAENDRNYTPIHEARIRTNLTAAEFRVEFLKLVEAGKVEPSSLQEMGDYPESYLEDGIQLSDSTIWFFYQNR